MSCTVELLEENLFFFFLHPTDEVEPDFAWQASSYPWDLRLLREAVETTCLQRKECKFVKYVQPL